MKKINLTILAMQSAHCQSRVKKSVEGLEEVNITSIKPGILEVEIPTDTLLKKVYTAVQSAGYEIMGVDSEEVREVQGKVLTFKSNINCMGCVESVAPALNEHPAIDGWRVDVNSKEKILTIESNGISEQEVINLVQSKGYKAEILKH